MDFIEKKKDSFTIVGFSAPGTWNSNVVHPIPDLWKKAYKVFVDQNPGHITGVCLPPRSNDYFYTCGVELDQVDFKKIGEGMTVHIFPAHKYVVFKHRGSAHEIPETYGEIWGIFDQDGYSITKGIPEIEVVPLQLFGKEYTDEYEMDIWIPVD
ncbi:GyrI-like domain-containing protein [Falsibacillus pallidus]|uniref:AraC family transcriptional regulator n=1 Tax=Falsibacillus pallidus TaxID=493781 RepID=A0A370G5L3_9BACI|nr:GyrI-like domain-containing protein [Falsibacillus pallidus]RDI39102.1 AraC family transcriptional regulator [Falsibacillus pallidus]